MKKVLLTVLSAILFLSGISHANAKTVFAPVKESEKASLKLNFDTGYVGGIELKAKVLGDVTVTGIDFNSAFQNYTTRYNYDEKSKILTIYVTTGSNTKNLLDNNKKLNIGTLNVTGTKQPAEYSLELQSLVYVDANYASKTETDFSTSKNSFVIGKQESSENNNNENNKPAESTNNNNQNSNTNNNSNSSNKEENNLNTDTEKDENESNNLEPSDNEDDKSNINSKPNKEEVKKEKSNFSVFPILLVIGVLAIAGIIVFVIKKAKDKTL